MLYRATARLIRVDRIAVAQAAGLKAICMDVEAYAVQTAFDLIRVQFPNEGVDQNVVLVDIGANLTHAAFAHDLDRKDGPPQPLAKAYAQMRAAELLGMTFRSFRYYAKKFNLR